MSSTPSVFKVVLMGLALTVVSSAIVISSQFSLFNHWTESLTVRPDFEGNGLNWLLIGLRLFVPVLDIIVMGIGFAIVIPIAYSQSLDSGTQRLGYLGPIAILLAAGAIGSLLLIGWGGTHVVLAMVAAPLMAISAIAAFVFVTFLNDRLAPA
jgi:hypothetical protein